MVASVSGSNLSGVWFKTTDLQVESAKGSWVVTTDGERYLDFSSGIAVTSTGHCHPEVVAAIKAQCERSIHAQLNVYTHDLLQPLAAELAAVTPPGIDTFFFSNSGAEITEAAVKLAKQATGRPNVIVLDGSFHGRTHQSMAMTSSKSVYRAGHAPLPSGVFVTPFPDVASLDLEVEIDRALAGFDRLLATVSAPAETAAVFVEPVLGEGGYIALPQPFMQGLFDRCKQHEILFVADEVQTGFGRTGKMFAVEHYDVQPDIICMAKGIASGFPFSALGMSRELDQKWPTGSHGGTYGGNALGCAAALATINVLKSEGFLDNVKLRGEQLIAGLNRLRDESEEIVDVRGLGLMVAVEFESPESASRVVDHCLQNANLILMTAGARSIRFMAPLTVSADEIELALEALGKAVLALVS